MGQARCRWGHAASADLVLGRVPVLVDRDQCRISIWSYRKMVVEAKPPFWGHCKVPALNDAKPDKPGTSGHAT